MMCGVESDRGEESIHEGIVYHSWDAVTRTQLDFCDA